jgi:hypothetical protein
MLTDKQLTWLFRHRLSSHNGFCCGYTRVPTTCPATTVIVNGELLLRNNCGYSCSFLKSAVALSESIANLLKQEKLIEEAKRRDESYDRGD